MNERIKELEALIQYHSDLYYNESEPEIADSEFDELWDELTAICPNSEVLKGAGAVAKGTGKLKHNTIMGSLAKATYDDEDGISELLNWVAKDTTNLVPGEKRTLSLTPKIDGCAIRLNYFNGKLIQAATRGDGQEGQDVLANAMMIDDIPNQTDQGFSGEIRGEVYMKRSVFDLLNGAGLELTHPRTAASGALNQKDPNETGKRKLSFMAYDIIFDADCDMKEPIRFEREKTWALKRLSGINAVEQKRVSVEDLENVLYDWEHNKRQSLDYEIDGLVFGWCSLEAQEDAGWSGKRPRGKLAWKFKPEQKITTIEGIEWQVGRTGKLTPVANITATQLSGSCIQRVTLHNHRFVEANKVCPGNKILLEKAGEIIPKVVKVVEQDEHYENCIPSVCPNCAGEVKVEGAHLVCQNFTCSAKLEMRVAHYLDRIGCMGIGPSTVKGLVNCGALSDLSDIYFMNSDDVRVVTGSDTVTRKMLNEVLDKDELPLDVFLSALGIHLLGRTTSKILAKEYRTLEAIQNASFVSMVSKEGIGEGTAEAIGAGLEALRPTIERILEVIEVTDVEDATGPLAGMSFCLTGSMSRPRKSIAADIEAAGGEVRSSVGKGLTYLVQADPSSESSKTKKAAKNGTQVISEEHLMGLIG
jgi:DNA ligase (NAD+)